MKNWVIVLPLVGQFEMGRRILRRAIDTGETDAGAHMLMSAIVADEDPAAALQQRTLAPEKWFWIVPAAPGD